VAAAADGTLTNGIGATSTFSPTRSLSILMSATVSRTPASSFGSHPRAAALLRGGSSSGEAPIVPTLLVLVHGAQLEALELLCAHVGDCRAVLCRGGQAVRLTQDHRPDRKDEQLRIRQAGGGVFQVAGIWRCTSAAGAARAVDARAGFLEGESHTYLSCSRTLGDPELKANLFLHRAQDPYPFEDKSFDLVISLATLHNLRIFELQAALSQIQRVGKQGYIMLESYRNEQELFNLQCWALTCESFFDEQEWIWLYNHFGYTGDYEFIYF
jgi:serine/threonine protein phosphatase PrpC